MSIEFKIIERKNPQSKNESHKYYAIKAAGGETSLQDLCHHIEENSSLSKATIYTVVTTLSETIPYFLALGNTVRLGALGSLQVSFGSLPSVSKAAVSEENIIHPRLVYRPSLHLKAHLKNLRYRKIEDSEE